MTRLTPAQRRFLERMVDPSQGCAADLPGAEAVRAALLAKGLVRRPPGCGFVVLTAEGRALVLRPASRAGKKGGPRR